MKTRPSAGILFATFMMTVLIWGSTWLFIKITLDKGITPLWGTALRFFFAALFMFIISFRRLRIHPPRRSQLKLIVAHGLFMIAASNALVFWGQQFIPSSLSSILFAVFPLMVAVYSHFSLEKEKLNGLKLAGILLGFAGILFIFFDPGKIHGSASVYAGMAAIILSVLFITVPTVLIKRDGDDLDPFVLNTWGIFIGFLSLLILARSLEGPLPATSNHTALAALVYLGIFGSGITFVAYFWLMKYVDITRLSFSAYLTPLVTLAAAGLFYGETVRLQDIGGMIFIFSGIFISDFKSYRNLIQHLKGKF